MAKVSFQEYSSPLRKLTKFFRKSRDQWKAKHRLAKQEIKRLTNRQRAVEQSRQMWRNRAEDAQCRIQELERSLEALKRPASAANNCGPAASNCPS